MLLVKKGNLFLEMDKPGIIAHGVNAQGKMASGFAAMIREKYPLSYLAYYTTYMNHGLHLGEMIIRVCEEDGKKIHVCHCVTQRYYGRDSRVIYVDYDAVQQSLMRVVDYAQKCDLPIHLPFIGGGLANGDRTQLLEIFTSVFANVPATLWLG